MMTILFDKWISHIIPFVQTHKGNLFTMNHHLLILNSHNSHVAINIVHKTRGLGLNLIILSSHTSHALQLLDIMCFKLVKISFKIHKDMWTVINKGKGVGKEDFGTMGVLSFQKNFDFNKHLQRFQGNCHLVTKFNCNGRKNVA
jgi:hypothetical protein